MRAEIARSREKTSVLARRYGVSDETIRKWRKRGPDDCLDHSSRPKKLPWKASDEERAIVCELRRVTGFALDDLTFVITHFLPHLNRDSIWRILKSEGLNRLPAKPATQPAKGQGSFKDYDLGFIHIDVKHLPKLHTGRDEYRSFLYVAVDRASRSAYLAVYDDENAANAVAFLKAAVAAFPFKVTHVLTDRGSCFTADAFKRACVELGVQHRKTKPYTPQTNGMVSRNGRIAAEVLGITIHTHADLETLRLGFHQAYNNRRQRVLNGKSPNEVATERIKAAPECTNPYYNPPPADALDKAMRVAEQAKEISQPDNYRSAADKYSRLKRLSPAASGSARES